MGTFGEKIQEFLLRSTLRFVQIAEFDWLPGQQKGLFSKEIIKNPLLRNHKMKEADTLHVCL